MSRYLIQRIEENPGIEVHYKTEVVNLEGDTHLERVTWRDKDSLASTTQNIRHVFIMAGAPPPTHLVCGGVSLHRTRVTSTPRASAALKQDRERAHARPPPMPL